MQSIPTDRGHLSELVPKSCWACYTKGYSGCSILSTRYPKIDAATLDYVPETPWNLSSDLAAVAADNEQPTDITPLARKASQAGLDAPEPKKSAWQQTLIHDTQIPSMSLASLLRTTVSPMKRQNSMPPLGFSSTRTLATPQVPPVPLRLGRAYQQELRARSLSRSTQSPITKAADVPSLGSAFAPIPPSPGRLQTPTPLVALPPPQDSVFNMAVFGSPAVITHAHDRFTLRNRRSHSTISSFNA